MDEEVYIEEEVETLVENDSHSQEEDDEELVCEILENLEKAKEHFSNWRQSAMEEERFYAGDQWSEEDRLKLEQEGRPVITFNRMIKFINVIAGMELQNRQEVRYIPTEVNDAGFAETMTTTAQWARSKCNAEDEESEAFQDCIKIGMGWIETRIDFEEDIDGQIMIERVSPYEMLWDKNAQKNNLTDARWVAHIKHIPVKEFNELWPDADPEIGDFWDGDDPELHNANPQYNYKYKEGEAQGQANHGLVSVVQYQYWRRERIYRYRDVDGKIKEANEQDFAKIKPILDEMGARYVRQYRRVYRQCILNGENLLEKGDCPTNEFSFNAITGLKDKYNNYWFGMMRLLMDPQRWSNKWFSQLLHIINSNAKGGIIVEDGVLSDPKEAMDNWARPDSITFVNPGKLDRIRDKPAPTFPAGIDRVLQYALQAFTDVTGVNAEVLGMVDRNQPGVLEQHRKESVYGQLQQFFDALRHYRKLQGRVLANFIREYIADDDGSRIIRIVGDDGVKYVPLLKNDVSLKYDVMIGDSPTAPNQRERTASLIMTLVPMMQSAGMPIPADIIEYLPMPDALKEKWKETIAQSKELPPEQKALQDEMIQKDLMLVDMNLERQQLKNEELRTIIDLNTAKSQKEMSTAASNYDDIDDSEAQFSAESILDYYKLEREQARKDAEFIANRRTQAIKAMLNNG
jgi:hypothetical protein